MRRSNVLWLGLLACFACAPEEGPGSSSSDRPGGSADAAEASPVVATEYVTALQFLPHDDTRMRGLTLQFANLASVEGLARRYIAWELARSGWRSLLDAEYTDAGTRAAWRLFPAAAFHLTVTPDGDPETLILESDESEYALELGSHLDRWEDRAGTRHEIRQAIWVRRRQRIDGIAVQHRFAVPEPERPTRFGFYERAMLRSQDGAVIVLFHTRDPETYGSPFAWMYADGLTRRWTALETRIVEVAHSAQLRRNVPVRIWFRIPEPDIRCELTAAERQFDELPAETGPKPYNALYRVRGWIEFAGERRSVEGFLERGEP